ncbi:MAG: alpha-amylase [Deltaproteobacteria bacterium]|nr:alpha-amylase [Deltaproteobacteria bacterium]
MPPIRTTIEAQAPTSIRDASITPRGRVFASPSDWRDQFVYFLLVDRFSSGNNDPTAIFDRNDPTAQQFDKRQWMQQGKVFCGGKITGITKRLGYLKQLGVTTVWVSPVLRQRRELATYHGYAIMDFLDVDPRFGTRQELRDMVDAAHDLNMYIILDIIYNHMGDNFYYNYNGEKHNRLGYRFAPPYDVHGWRLQNGDSSFNIQTHNDAVWPAEFQDPNWYIRAGSIGKWDPEPWEDPMHDDNEFRRGDFCELKDINHKTPALGALIRAYQYWIAITDCDGFRIDTTKHVTLEASRNFCGAIREYCESIGKENFLLLAEVAGGAAMARNYLEIFKRNVDAVIDFGEPAKHLISMVKGTEDPRIFFSQFGGHDAMGSHRELGRYHLGMFNDHDHIGRSKARFMSGNIRSDGTPRYEQAAHAIGVQLTTLGIPGIYYGTEQAFDGSTSYHNETYEPKDENGVIPFEDRYIRETMFGGGFGAFGTNGCHFFDSSHPTYTAIAAIASIRNRHDDIGMTLRRGRQYQREVRSCGDHTFALTNNGGGVVAWSRILMQREVIIVLNTQAEQTAEADITIDSGLHPPASPKLHCLYPTNSSIAMPQYNIQYENGRSFISLTLPGSGMLILT